MEVNRKDYRLINEFSRYTYTYKKIEEKEKYMIWEINPNTNKRYFQYELWRVVLVKNPDGTIVAKKPSDEDFGTTAWYVCGNEEQCMEKMERLIRDIVRN